MDPNLFHLDWERTFEVLSAIVILAFVAERALSVVFENRLLLPLFAGNGVKELTALAVAFFVCRYTEFDALRMIVLGGTSEWPGELLTAGIIAGGSKGAVMLFRDVLKWRSSAYQEYLDLRGAGVPSMEAAKKVAGGRKADGGAAVPPEKR